MLLLDPNHSASNLVLLLYLAIITKIFVQCNILFIQTKYCMETKICALPECNNPVINWRIVCCCTGHQKRYSGLRSRGLIEKVDNPKPAPIKRGLGLSAPTKYKDKSPEQKGKWSAYVVARRKKRDLSMPKWANKDSIESFYIKARELTASTGIKHEVDHIIPSNHKLVCGLHVESNLQILTEFDNISKNNKFIIE